MKIWLMKLRLGFGIWLREYLGISRIERTLGQLRDDGTLEAHVRQLRIDEARHYLELMDAVADTKAAVLLLDSRCDAAFVRRGNEIADLQAEHKKQYTDLMATQQETEQKIDRLLMLLEPQAARLRATRPPVPDWDEVQRDNLKQFEEKETTRRS